MSTVSIAAPSASLMGDAYAQLASELRILAARVTAGAVRSTPPDATSEPAAPGTERSPRLRLLLIARDLVVLFVVLPIIAFNVAFQLFPPVR